MTRRRFLKIYLPKFAAFFVVAGLIVYFGAHSLDSMAGSLITTPLRKVTDTRVAAGTGYLFRDEEILVTDADGLVQPLVESGKKVSKDVAVAEIREGSASLSQETLDRTNRQIALLESVADVDLIDLAAVRSTAQSDYLALRLGVAGGVWSGLGADADTLTADLLALRSLTEGGKTPAEVLSDLKSHRDALLGKTVGTVFAAKSSGVYHTPDRVDGYESIFTKSALETLTPASFAALCEDEPTLPSGTIAGKMVYGYEWYLAVSLDAESAASLSVGRYFPITFPENRGVTLSLLCERLIGAADGTIAVFVSTSTPAGFRHYRSQPMEIEIESRTGFYIPDSAVREEDGREGVYVFEGNVLKFSTFECLYRGDGYIIAKIPEIGEAGLSSNDLIVTYGRNLYDGKVYQ